MNIIHNHNHSKSGIFGNYFNKKILIIDKTPSKILKSYFFLIIDFLNSCTLCILYILYTFAESSLKAQSEMQSCKLNESESRPNVTLKSIIVLI